MKNWIKLVISACAGFIAGGVGGYFLRKKTAEVQFVECSEEELAKLMAENEAAESDEEPARLPEITRPLDIQRAIDGGDTDGDEAVGFVQMDTQKEQYFQKWKTEEIASKYDTRTDVPEETIEEGEEEDEDYNDDDFMDNVAAEADRVVNGLDIEPGSIDDWDHWSGIPDGKYDTIELNWYEGDDILTDENFDPVDNPEKCVGSDIDGYFKNVPTYTTDDPDIRVVINHKMRVVYRINRLSNAKYGEKKAMEEFGSDDDDDGTEWIRSRRP